MKKILALIMSVCLLSSFMSVYAEDTDYINEDDPMTYRNSVDFFEDEDGNICEEAGIAVESMNSLKQDQSSKSCWYQSRSLLLFKGSE